MTPTELNWQIEEVRAGLSRARDGANNGARAARIRSENDIADALMQLECEIRAMDRRVANIAKWITRPAA